MVVVVVNVKVLISSFEYTFWMMFWIGISLVGYYVFYFLFSFFIVASPLYGLMQQSFVMSQNYFVASFCTFCYIIIDEGLRRAGAEVRVTLREQRRLMELKKLKAMREDTTLETDRISNFVHTGFAFSQAPGNDTLVTDKLTNRLKDALQKQLFPKLLMESTGDLAVEPAPVKINDSGRVPETIIEEVAQQDKLSLNDSGVNAADDQQ